MAQLRLALAQVNPTVGDLDGNAALVLQLVGAGRRPAAPTWSPSPRWCSPATRSRTSRCARPSSTRPARRSTGCRRAARRRDGLGDLPVVVGYLDPRRRTPLDGARHAARARRRTPPRSCTTAGSSARYAKHHLPNYGVFDEYRYFVPGHDADRRPGRTASTSPWPSARTSGRTAARSPSTREAGAGLLLVINGSPYEREQGRHPARRWCARRAARGRLHARLRQHGRRPGRAGLRRRLAGRRRRTASVLARAPQFDEDLLVVDLDLPAPHGRPTARPAEASARRPAPIEPMPRRYAGRSPSPARRAAPRGRGRGLRRARRSALRDYVRKNGFRSVVLGLSGGIDSALVAAIAATRSARTNVDGVSMPSSYSVRALPGRRRRPRRAHRPGLPRSCRSRRWSSAFLGNARADRARRGEPAGPGARRRS